MSARTLLVLAQAPPIPRPLLAEGLVGGLALTGTVIGILFIALLGGGVAVLVRRARTNPAVGQASGPRANTAAVGSTAGSRAGSRAGSADPAIAANIALVRLDDAVAESADEVGFAIAQFGEERAAGFRDALDSARRDLATAFALGQRRNDSVPDSATQVREWNARIVDLCTVAGARLSAERATFDTLRQVERASAGRLEALRRLLDHTRLRLDPAAKTLDSLARDYSAEALVPIVQAPDEARRLIVQATQKADAAASGLDGSGVNSISSILDVAERDARRAVVLLDHVDQHATALARSSDRLDDLLGSARGTAQAAREQRDSEPDPSISVAIDTAVEGLDAVIGAVGLEGRRDPDASIARLESELDALDRAQAAARTAADRLEHARIALAGAVLTARSQIETTGAYIADRRGSTGAEARTRLAEARRLLAIAEAEADPVIALDTARSSATYSRDADALARYDLL